MHQHHLPCRPNKPDELIKLLQDLQAVLQACLLYYPGPAPSVFLAKELQEVKRRLDAYLGFESQLPGRQDM